MRSLPPYRPFRGAPPPHFVDRPDPGDLVQAGLSQTALLTYLTGPSDPRFHRLVISPPHTGKTALLREIARRASQELGWATAVHTCRPKELVLGQVAGQVLAAARARWPAAALPLPGGRPWRGPRPSSPEGAAAMVGWLPGSEPASAQCVAPVGAGGWSDLRQVLERLGSIAHDESRGLLIALDDVHLLSGADVECVGHLARVIAGDGLPVAFLLSGGRDVGDRFARAHYFGATVWPTWLGWFEEAEAREALVVPAAERGVDFEEEALEIACARAAGDPLAVQRLGFASWSAAAAPDRVTAGDVEAACWRVEQPAAEFASSA